MNFAVPIELIMGMLLASFRVGMALYLMPADRRIAGLARDLHH